MDNNTTKLCPQCGIEKPISEYYVRGSGHLYKICKKCHTQTTALYPQKLQESPEHETQCVKWLNSRGVPAMHGKDISGDEFFFVDVVAFGCIKIEVKLVQQDGQIHFTSRQIATPYSDIIIIQRFGRDFHIFDMAHYQFYKNGMLSKVVRADTLDFLGSLNRIDLIEQKLMQKRLSLVDKSKEPESVQMSLFPTP